MKYSGCPKQKSSMRLIIKGIIILISALIILQFINEKSSPYFKTHNLLNRRAPLSLKLNRHDLYMKKGEEFHLFVVALNKRVSYTSTDFRVAGVNFNGRIYAYQTGDCFILVKVDDRVLKCRVHVMAINKSHITLRIGKSQRLSIQGIGTFVSWKSSNPEVAVVNLFGKVKAKRRGRTIISGRVKGRTFSCEVRVNE